MQKSRSMILGLALALAIPTATLAQSTPSGDVRSATCRVTNINAGEKSFTADCPDGTMTFTTTSSTQFTRSMSGATGGGTASMTDLKAGDQVRVTFNPPAGGTTAGAKPAATRVEIMPATGGGASGSGSSGSMSGPQGVQTASQTNQPQNGSSAQSAQQPYGQQAGSQQAGSQQANKVTGRVASVDRQNRTLIVETSHGRETFKVDPSNTSVDFNSIREGEQVEIQFQGTGAERRITTLRMMPDQTGQSGQQQPAAQRPAGYQQQPAEQRAGQRTSAATAAGGNKVTGRVVTVDQNQLVIETARGRETFAIDPQQTNLNFASYKPGDQVQVMFTGTGNDKRITSIQAAGEQRTSRDEQGSDAAPAGQRLPQTASEIPFIALVGLFMLAAAFGLRFVRRHV